jgi:N-acyl-D-amino-acid deacylase
MSKERKLMSNQIDTLIKGAKVVDGSGNPWFYGDVAISGDRILDVRPAGRIAESGAAQIVDASGMVVCPGFIDIQSHAIVPLMVDGRCLSKITQGVTTEIMGEAWTPAPVGGRNDGGLPDRGYSEHLAPWREQAVSWSRFSDWLEAMESSGVSPNVGSFLGAGTLRRYAMGMDMGQPNAEQLQTMRRVMADAMEDGAFGVSYALIYPPDSFADTAEITEVCKVVGSYGGVYITHVRSEADQLIEGIQEAIDIGAAADVAVEIYHLKAAGKRNWGKIPQVIEQINQARASGLDVTADMYPYPYSGTGLSSVMPPWVHEGGTFFEKLRDPETLKQVKDATLKPSGDWEPMADLCTPEGVIPVGLYKEENIQFRGMPLSQIAEAKGVDWFDAAVELLLTEEQRVGTIYITIDEANIPLQLQQSWNKVSTDAGGLDPEWAAPQGPVHPRAYGTYPRVLGRYVRDEKALELEDAVRKMSGAVADRLDLRDRGMLRSGMFADVVVFNPETVIDNSTIDDSHRLSTGIEQVWVNGQQVVSNGVHTGAKPGRFVKGPGAS